MEYLFFDVECANCFQGLGKLCEFGYCLTDSDFNVLEEQNFLINPNATFDRYVLKGMLHYTESEYKANPKFEAFYQTIISLLTRNDCVVVGHTVGGDAKYVGADCMRYNLDPPDFKHIDLVEIYKGVTDQKEAVALTRMCELLGVEKLENAHCALADAQMTMLCAKAICRSQNKSLIELIKEYPRCKGELINYKQEYLQKKTHKRYIAECQKKGMVLISRDQEKMVNIFRRVVKPNKKITKNKLNYKRVCISYNYECFRYQNTLKLIQLIANCGAKSVAKPSKCNIFVTFDIDYGDGLLYCSRKEQAEKVRKEGHDVEFITIERLFELLEITPDALDKMHNIEEDKITYLASKVPNLIKKVGTGASVKDILQAKSVNLTAKK